MPTHLDLAGIEIPSTVEGLSLVGSTRREWLYGECHEGDHATRMVREGRYKLIYYAVGNRSQLFDLDADPHELHDLSRSPEHEEVLERLTQRMVGSLYGSDAEWLHEGQLVGLPDKPYVLQANRGLSGQRGTHGPTPTRGFTRVNPRQKIYHATRPVRAGRAPGGTALRTFSGAPISPRPRRPDGSDAVRRLRRPARHNHCGCR